jgi:hypothetical protein
MYDNSHAPGPHGRSLTVLLVVLMAAISGCTSPARFTPVSGSDGFPPYEGEVKVLENLPPSDQYKRVGVVIIEGVLLTKESTMLAAIKKQAAANGADAVVMQSKIKVTKDPDGSTRKRLGAWAIRLNK